MTSSPTYAIEAKGLVKRFGDKTALHGVDFAVPAGTVTAVLGPNGAGKTTAVRILTTLSSADAGTAKVAGFDVASQGTQVRRRIGLTAQEATVDGLLTGRENLQMLGELHHLGKAEASKRADQLLEDFSLSDSGDRLARDYSGGMRRRLDLAATIVARPEVLFLDEPTTGLDPRARAELWDVLDQLVGRGTTLMLTTQYLEEAERLADDIVVIDHGRVIAQGDSRELKRRVGGDQLQVVVREAAQLEHAAKILGRGANAEVQVDEGSRSATVPTRSGVAALAAVSVALADAGIEVDDLGMRQPTLDEVFLTLTGSPVENAEELQEATR
ncbi:MAG: ATP-binding cassette domain-containing protein [Solirubrobacteraceae bacterium]|nr:ATP-binding cassette domain-containing protein [Solirubrobacteraceae bacterium]